MIVAIVGCDTKIISQNLYDLKKAHFFQEATVFLLLALCIDKGRGCFLCRTPMSFE